MNNGTPLIKILRKRDWLILKKFIPPALFMETNLPAIKIIIRDTGATQSEEAPLALSLYIPGRPLFRIGGSRGVIIPLEKKGSTSHCTVIDQYYTLDYSSLSFQRKLATLNRLPEEFRSYLKCKGLNVQRVGLGLLDEIKPRNFYDIRMGNRCYHWLSWADGCMFSILLRTYPRAWNTLSRVLSGKNKNVIIRIVHESSISYGRYYNINTNETLEETKPKLRDLLYKLGAFTYELRLADIFRLLYAVDYIVKVRKSFIKDQNQLADIFRSKCFDISQKPAGLIPGVRILCSQDTLSARNPRPIVMGYKIESTDFLKLYLRKDLLTSFAGNLVATARKASDLSKNDFSRLSFSEIFKILTVNQVFLNVLKFFLANDLSITDIALHYRMNLENIVNFAVIYNDLYSSAKVTQELYRRDCDSSIDSFTKWFLYDVVKKLLEDLKKDNPKILAIKYLTFGLREKSLVKKSINYNEIKDFLDNIKDRLKELLCIKDREDWREKHVISVLNHTFTHHLISRISANSRTSINYLSEVFDIGAENAGESIELFENVSGGIGAIRTTLGVWSSDEALLIEDFILRFGRCLTGTPEDIIYFTLVSIIKGGKSLKPELVSSNFMNRVLSTVNAMRIIVTPEELKETIKVFNSLISEAERLSRLAGRSTQSIDPNELLEDVVKLRWDCETEMRRFCTTSEIIVYFVKHLNKYAILRDILTELLIRYLDSKRNVYNKLIGIYGVADKRRIAEQVLEDLHCMVRGLPSNLYNKYEDYSKLIGGIITDIGRLIAVLLAKLLLKSCDTVCGLCYLNTYSCRFSAPWIQSKLLNRRLAKLYSSYLLRTLPLKQGELNLDNLSSLVGKILLDGEYYLVLGD